MLNQKTVKFLATFSEGRLGYPGNIANYRSAQIISIDGVDWCVGLFVGDTLPEGVEAYTPEEVPVEAQYDTVTPTRYLDLLGDAASDFKTKIKLLNNMGDEVSLGTASKLEVAEKYMDASTEIALGSEKIVGFLGLLVHLGILTADDVVRIQGNQTVEEAAAVAA